MNARRRVEAKSFPLSDEIALVLPRRQDQGPSLTECMRKRTGRRGMRKTDEYLLAREAEKKKASPEALARLKCLHVRHRKYTVPKTKHVIPRSTVTREEWARML